LSFSAYTHNKFLGAADPQQMCTSDRQRTKTENNCACYMIYAQQ
jgi:hypothetical protein